MNKREARRRALEAACGLIDINIRNGSAGDLEGRLYELGPNDQDKFLDALKGISDGLWRRAEALRDKGTQ